MVLVSRRHMVVAPSIQLTEVEDTLPLHLEVGALDLTGARTGAVQVVMLVEV